MSPTAVPAACACCEAPILVHQVGPFAPPVHLESLGAGWPQHRCWSRDGAAWPAAPDRRAPILREELAPVDVWFPPHQREEVAVEILELHADPFRCRLVASIIARAAQRNFISLMWPDRPPLVAVFRALSAPRLPGRTGDLLGAALVGAAAEPALAALGAFATLRLEPLTFVTGVVLHAHAATLLGD